MATEKYLYHCTPRWANKLFLTKSCAAIIASGASCYLVKLQACEFGDFHSDLLRFAPQHSVLQHMRVS